MRSHHREGMSAGAAAEFLSAERIRAFLFAMLICLVLFVGWLSDKRSCERSNGVRASLVDFYDGTAARAAIRARVDHGKARVLDLREEHEARIAAARAHLLDCGLVPSVK